MADKCSIGYGCGEACITRSKSCISDNPLQKATEDFTELVLKASEVKGGTLRDVKPNLEDVLTKGRELAKQFIVPEVVDGEVDIIPGTGEFAALRNSLLVNSKISDKDVQERIKWDNTGVTDQRKGQIDQAMVEISRITGMLPKEGFKLFKQPGKHRGHADSGFSPELVVAFDNEIKDLPLQEKLNAASKEYRESGVLTPSINVGDPHKSEAKTIYHEYAHHIEFANRDMASLAQEWLVSRATGDVDTLNNLTGTKNYKESEIAVPGPFIHPYVGKIFRLPASVPGTEVLSVGLEHFYDPARMRELYKGDKEHFYFILGVLEVLRNG